MVDPPERAERAWAARAAAGAAAQAWLLVPLLADQQAVPPPGSGCQQAAISPCHVLHSQTQLKCMWPDLKQLAQHP